MQFVSSVPTEPTIYYLHSIVLILDRYQPSGPNDEIVLLLENVREHIRLSQSKGVLGTRKRSTAWMSISESIQTAPRMASTVVARVPFDILPFCDGFAVTYLSSPLFIGTQVLVAGMFSQKPIPFSYVQLVKNIPNSWKNRQVCRYFFFFCCHTIHPRLKWTKQSLLQALVACFPAMDWFQLDAKLPPAVELI